MSLAGLILLVTATIILVGVAADVIITTRRVERSRPPRLSDWRECDFGDFPSVSSLFHFGTDTRKGQ